MHTPTTTKIILKNLLTPFNTINLLLAITICLIGHPTNALFLGVAIINTAMGIFQELRAKRTLDRLTILARSKVTTIRNGQTVEIDQAEIKIGDTLIIATGNQIVADAIITKSDSLEIDESLLTGESSAIPKKSGDTVLSGSFVTAGQAHIRVTAIGTTSYAGRLSAEAKQMKKPTAPLMHTLNTVIKVLALVIVPLGTLLFFRQLSTSSDFQTSILGSAAAMVGMIPEGLVLLTGITLTVGALKLARKKALVQSLPSIETLARVDVLCLDKTGTITDGTLAFQQIIPLAKHTKSEINQAINATITAIGDRNPTAEILRQNFQKSGTETTNHTATNSAEATTSRHQNFIKFQNTKTPKTSWQTTATIPFSSVRKWSAASFTDQGSYIIGAPNFVFPDDQPAKLYKVSQETSLQQRAKTPYLTKAIQKTINEHAAQGHRVLILAHTKSSLDPETKNLPANLKPISLIILSDHIRPEAKQTFRHFRDQGVTLKVISGDDPKTVSIIAQQASITGATNYIDMSNIKPQADFKKISQEYTVFGRTSPEQKKHLITALKLAKHTVCMTGDGVNDVLALKEANCGVAMISGSDAARASADFVLMTSDFSAMIGVLKEGRRVINNIEIVASLYLVKTIYSTILTVLYMFIPHPYPFSPLQMTPINVFTVGIPSFFLALRPLYDKPKSRFITNIVQNSLPAAIIIVSGILVTRLLGSISNLPNSNIATINVILTATIGFALLLRISKPLHALEITMIILLVVAFIATITAFASFFGYTY